MKLDKACRYCKYLDPRDGEYYGRVEMFMCYEYKDSNYCGIDYMSLCKSFEWCDDLKEIMGGNDEVCKD